MSEMSDGFADGLLTVQMPDNIAKLSFNSSASRSEPKWFITKLKASASIGWPSAVTHNIFSIYRAYVKEGCLNLSL
jgi:hypothetical protein